MSKPKTFQQILDKAFQQSDGCWIWRGPYDKNGYGHLKHKQIDYRAHRFIYETMVGLIPDGKQLDHLCGVKNCVMKERI
jgi:hypothetical protein